MKLDDNQIMLLYFVYRLDKTQNKSITNRFSVNDIDVCIFKNHIAISGRRLKCLLSVLFTWI